jgi:CBS domain-containing protein
MEYAADYLDRVAVRDACSRDVIAFRASQTAGELLAAVATHQGFPVIDDDGRLVGVVTRRNFMERDPSTRVGELVTRPPAVVFPDNSLRDAADQMVRENVGRLPVVDRADPTRLVGIITRSDLLRAHEARLASEEA